MATQLAERPSRWQIATGFSIGSRGNTASKNKSIIRGLRYHRAVYKVLDAHVRANPALGMYFIEEPWLRCLEDKKLCQPDGVLIDQFTDGALAIEVKLNWKDGRDEKLLNTYLQAVKSAYGLSATWPLLITRNVRGYKGNPLLGLGQLEKAFEWRPGEMTPVLLLP